MYNTINYYNKYAKEYYESTKDINMDLQYEVFLEYLTSKSKILDLGCGSGRDSKYFIKKGHSVIPIDGSKEMCLLAEENLNIPVINKKFNEIDYVNFFNGIWACASLIHIDKEKLLIIMEKLKLALKKRGIIYISLKNGNGCRLDARGVFYQYYTREMIEELSNVSKMEILEYFKTNYLLNSDESKYWHNLVLRKK